jgi:hypothetical protein
VKPLVETLIRAKYPGPWDGADDPEAVVRGVTAAIFTKGLCGELERWATLPPAALYKEMAPYLPDLIRLPGETNNELPGRLLRKLAVR